MESWKKNINVVGFHRNGRDTATAFARLATTGIQDRGDGIYHAVHPGKWTLRLLNAAAGTAGFGMEIAALGNSLVGRSEVYEVLNKNDQKRSGKSCDAVFCEQCSTE